MEEKIQLLKEKLHEIDDLNSAVSLLSWDQSTYMPSGGAPARGRQMATLSKIAHEKFTSAEMGNLLDELQPFSQENNSDDAILVRVTTKDFEKATKIPAQFLVDFNVHISKSYQEWMEARPNNDFKRIEPYLEKTVDLSRQLASFWPHEHIGDPLIDMADEGMKAETIKKIFSELRQELVPIVKAITDQEAADDASLKQHYPEQTQLDFGLKVIEQFGYDFKRGRQDKTHHPFMTKFSIGDVRITTRTKENDLSEALFSTLHESGHAMYEQGINPGFEGSPLANGTSAGVHESQSRLWENLVGRSRGFWSHFYPKLQETFTEQLGEVPLDNFYKAINKVTPSLIRTDADEVTYNLHVMIRFDLEMALLEGKLAVKDLPEAWHARYLSDLGVQAPSDVDGVLQDIHWYAGSVGGSFQGYTLGNIMSALFFDEAIKAHPDIPNQIASGEFDTLHSWLKENIYQHGRKFTADELIQKVTGGPLTITPYINYLKTKYGELYTLS
ncbi:MAG: carboxypeptidase M32 [Chloroflexota bacterium]